MTEPPRVLIVESRYYTEVPDQLIAGATATLDEAGLAYDRLEVPGAFELPAAVRFAVLSMEHHSAPVDFGGFIALGCVIRGETDHYDHICRETSRALMELSLEHSLALGFGLLTCETHEQAVVRAAVDQKNKGADAARACLRMMELKQQLHLSPQ